MSQHARAPVGIISVGKIRTNLSDWTPDGPLFDRLRRAVVAAGPNSVRAILWDSGIAGTTGETISQLKTIIDAIAHETGCIAPWLVMNGSLARATSGKVNNALAGQSKASLIFVPEAGKSSSKRGDVDDSRAAAWLDAIEMSQIFDEAGSRLSSN